MLDTRHQRARLAPSGTLHAPRPAHTRCAGPSITRWSASVQRSSTTVIPAARRVAATRAFRIPSWNHTTFGAGCMARNSGTCSGSHSLRRNTSTMSTGRPSSARLPTTRSPQSVRPTSAGFTGRIV